MTSPVVRDRPVTATPRRRESRPTGRDLRVVGRRHRIRPLPGSRLAAQRRARRLLAIAGIATFVLVLGAVAVQVMLIGGQRQIDRINASTAKALVAQDGLRRKESELRSPSDVRDLATERLGMVPADLPALVQPAPRVVGYPAGDPRGAATPTPTVTPAASPTSAVSTPPAGN